MDPVVRGALALSLLALLTRAAQLRRPAESGSASVANVASTPSNHPSALEPAEAPCPRGTLPDGNVCVPTPDPNALGQALADQQNEHHDRSGQLRVYDQIPRRPDRPQDFRKY